MNIFFKRDNDNYLLEAFRVLRTNMYFLEKKANQVILFTSTIPNEGKSTISSNYAMSVATTGKKVIYVNCDIRRSRSMNGVNKKINHGVESFLLGKKTLDELLIKKDENFDILPAKHLKGDVTELFLGEKIKELIEELKKRYDLVILDSPPLTIATDSAILSEYADGVIYVCGHNMVEKKKMIRAKKILDRAGAKIYGVVINKIDEKHYIKEYGYDDYSQYENYINGNKDKALLSF